MTGAERSVLTYLLDAIECAPLQAGQLMDVAIRPGASGGYRWYIARLRDAFMDGDVNSVAVQIREEIR